MRLPSVAAGLEAWKRGTRRFPEPFVFSLALTLFYVLWIAEAFSKPMQEGFLYQALMVCSLGVVGFIALDLALEPCNLSRSRIWRIRSAGLLTLCLYAMLLPRTLHRSDLWRFYLTFASFIFLITFSGFFNRRNNEHAFWQFNRLLLQRFIQSAAFGAALFVGLFAGFSMFRNLFDVGIKETTYLYLWGIVTGIFCTSYFLAGIPTDLNALARDQTYPKALKIFAQFILIPLVTLYLAILMLYAVKITVLWNLPKGWVSNLILGASIFGILTLLIVHPLRSQKENLWITWYSRYFYGALFPLLLLFVVAIYRRIHDYGITEERYLLLVFAPWLFGIALYFSASRSKNIQIIPVSLCLLLMLSAWGPWSASAVSRASQLMRLKNLLEKAGFLRNGKIVTVQKDLSLEDRKNISSMVTYLSKSHGLAVLAPWGALPSTDWDDLMPKDLLKAWGITFAHPHETEDYLNLYAQSNSNTPLPIAGYDYVVEVRLTVFEGKVSSTTIATDKGPLQLTYDPKTLDLALHHQATNLSLPIADLIAAHQGRPDGNIAQSEMVVSAENKTLRARLMLQNLNCKVQDGRMQVQNLSGRLFYRLSK